MEEWRDIPGYEGIYQVSNEGRVRSLERFAEINGIKHKHIRVLDGVMFRSKTLSFKSSSLI